MDIKLARCTSAPLSATACPPISSVIRSGCTPGSHSSDRNVEELLADPMRDPDLPGEDVYIHGELKVRSSTRLPERLTAAA